MSVYSGDKQALYIEARRLEAENIRLREAIHAHRIARQYNPRAPWVDARLWDAIGEAGFDASNLPLDRHAFDEEER